MAPSQVANAYAQRSLTHAVWWWSFAMQFVVVCCSVLQCVAVCCLADARYSQTPAHSSLCSTARSCSMSPAMGDASSTSTILTREFSISSGGKPTRRINSVCAHGTCVSVHECACACVSACVCVRACVRARARACMCVRARMCACMCAYVCVCVCMCVCTCGVCVRAT